MLTCGASAAAVCAATIQHTMGRFILQQDASDESKFEK